LILDASFLISVDRGERSAQEFLAVVVVTLDHGPAGRTAPCRRCIKATLGGEVVRDSSTT